MGVHHGSAMQLQPVEDPTKLWSLKAVLPDEPASPGTGTRDKVELSSPLPYFLGRMLLMGQGGMGEQQRVDGVLLVVDTVCTTVLCASLWAGPQTWSSELESPCSYKLMRFVLVTGEFSFGSSGSHGQNTFM